MSYIVYVHISPSNKLYIGITSKTLDERAKKGRNYQGQYFSRAIQKYGWDNIQHIVLLEGLSKEVACECEKYLIAKYQTNNSKYGYNLTMGGDGTLGKKLSEESKRKIGDGNRGKIHSKELNEKVSQSLKQYYKDNPESIEFQRNLKKELWKNSSYRQKTILSMTGRVMSEEQKQKISRHNKGKHKFSDYQKTLISNTVKAQHEKEKQLGIKRNIPRKAVNQYSLDGEFIKTYESGRIAALQLGLQPIGISNCCNNKRKMCGGYIWRFV